MKNHIETIIFDLGGVLINWNPRNMFRKMFADEKQMEYFLQNITTMEWNEQQDAGRKIADATAALVAQHPEWATEIQAYYDRWTEMLDGAIGETVELLTRLYEGKQYRLYALTNWSGELFPYALANFPFLQFFEGILVSGDEGLKKPDLRIYNLILERYHIDPTKAVFIDDSWRNIEGAQAAFLNTIHFLNPAQLRADLEAMGVVL
jgi:2-haloacid dehalogenase